VTKKKVKQGEIGGVAVFFIAFLIAICLLAMGHGFYHMGIVTGAAIDRAFVTEEEQAMREANLLEVISTSFAPKFHLHDGRYSKKGHEHPSVPDCPIWDGGPGDIILLDDDITFTDTLNALDATSGSSIMVDLGCDQILECVKEVL